MARLKTIPCRYFQTARGCNYGDQCRFSHDPGLSIAAESQASRSDWRSKAATDTLSTDGRSPTSVDRLRTWKRQLHRNIHIAHTDVSAIGHFWRTAVELVSEDNATLQAVVIELASEDGLKRIDELVTLNDDVDHRYLNFQRFTTRFVPLFHILGRHYVQSSFTLEGSVTGMLNFLYGPGGKRLVKILSIVQGYLEDLSDLVDPEVRTLSQGHDASLAAFDDVFSVIAAVIDLNGGAQVHGIIPALIEQISSEVEDILEFAEHTSECEALNSLARIQRRLGVGRTIPNYAQPDRKTSSKPVFQLTRDGPGNLSAFGPRHDNDSENIREIQILPTLAEVQSLRLEYLPYCDSSTWHIGGVNGLLDRQFRLLREDTVGQLRDAIQDELLCQSQSQGLRKIGNGKGARKNAYRLVRVDNVSVQDNDGLCLDISLPQPEHLRTASQTQRKDWWELSRRLQPDAVVCLVQGEELLLFCCVRQEIVKKHAQGDEQLANPPPVDRNMFSDQDVAFARLKACNIDRSAARSVLQIIGSRDDLSLVEFPGVLLPAFQPVLEALQGMVMGSELPFASIIAADNSDAEQEELRPPLYALRPGFRFNLRPLTKDDSDLHLSVTEDFDVALLQENSELDATQSETVISTLRRKLSLIQGPPGTGKSFVGVALIQTLLANRDAANLGPILCVCYTNHALDQLLEHLLDRGVQQIIRVGSRTKSERLQELQLNRVAIGAERSSAERVTFAKNKKELADLRNELEDLFDRIMRKDSWRDLEKYLLREHPEYHDEIFCLVDNEGFKRNIKPERAVDAWIDAGRSQGMADDLQSSNRFAYQSKSSSSRSDRLILHRQWVEESRKSLQKDILDTLTEFARVRRTHHGLRMEAHLRCLQQSHIIGVTTSGLARNIDLLRRVPCKVLLCEEAGEVLESHLLTAMLPSIEHAILIGDHQQLRPQVQRYDLSQENVNGQKYSLDVSLFERLLKRDPTSGRRGLPFSTLETQRRMHPQISRLIRETLYPRLRDDARVLSYPEVSGMEKRLAWLDHRHPEAGAAANDIIATSHTNPFEVRMASALASHLLHQGTYRANDIAVLTPYLGQLRLLRQELSTTHEIVLNDRDLADLEVAGDDNDTPRHMGDWTRAWSRSSTLEALKVATIDNFQGEEAKVVIVSMVRSNPEDKCGFLKTSNRINVLLSRAMHGMYIIGNARTAESVQMWSDVLALMRQNDAVNPYFDLRCDRHPDTRLIVENPEDFQQMSPEGGCFEMCASRLSCGHACVNKCHSTMLHDAVVCLEPCPRSRVSCAHACTSSCGEKCPPKCEVNVHDATRRLPCGHSKQDVPCWQSYDLSQLRCEVPVERTILGCGHRLTLPCHVSVSGPDFECRAPCGSPLLCGHSCRRKCGACKQIAEQGDEARHSGGDCQEACDRDYTTCGHRCAAKCHGGKPCPLCTAQCDVFCAHSRCSKKCHEPCAPCAEQTCASRCPHSACSMPCAAPCDWSPCQKRCVKTLSCGHQCPSLCGETCPEAKYCQKCCAERVKELQVDLLEMRTYGEIDLDEDPCIFPKCGHVMTVTSMDGQMEMSAHYEESGDGSLRAIRSSRPFSMDQLKGCSMCRGSLRNICRYGRFVRRALLDESTKKFILWSNREMGRLREVYQRVQANLAKNDVKLFIQNPVEIKISPAHNWRDMRDAMENLRVWRRYKEMWALHWQITMFANEVAKEEQPFHRVWQFCEDARRRRQTGATFDFDRDVLQTKQHLAASALLIRCELTLVSDFISNVRQKVQPPMLKGLRIDLIQLGDRAMDLHETAISSERHVEATESLLFLAQRAILQRFQPDGFNVDELNNLATDCIKRARRRCEAHPSATRGLMSEVEAVQLLLTDGTFHSVVTSEERLAVLRAMAREMTGTGHWYYCANGHPFTIGECGMPMQQARCPECGAAVGGQNHRAVEGVRRAEDLEGELGRLVLN